MDWYMAAQVSKGWQPYYNAALKATKVQVKGSAGKILGWNILNGDAAAEYLQVFDATSGNVTVGTTVPTFVIPLVASGSTAAQVSFPGYEFVNGLTVAATTTPGGSTAGSNGLLVTLFYA